MKKIAIIGGGISGLYIANLLRQNSGYEIIVYEKNNSINLEKGYGIQLSVNSIKLLNKIGFQSINLKDKFHPNKLDFYSLKNKKKICDLDISAFNTNEVKYTTLQRFTLINFLKERLPNNLINYNKKVTKVNHDTKKIELTFEDNDSIKCDYLIISDGTFSKTKSLIANKVIKPKYFNSIALRATIDKDNLKDVVKILSENTIHYDEIGTVNDNSLIIYDKSKVSIDDLIKSHTTWLTNYMSK